MEESNDLHLRQPLILGCPGEQHLYLVARFHIEKICEFDIQEHAIGLALQGVHRTRRGSADEIGIDQWSNLTEGGGIDGSHVAGVFVDLAFHERVEQAVNNWRRRLNARHLELLGVLRGMLERADRGGRDPDVRAHHEPGVPRFRLVVSTLRSFVTH